MILIPYLRTKRLAVQLREITYGQARAVCALPADRHEATTTEFLKAVVERAEAPTAAYVTNPRLWTVEERARVVCHYLSQVSETGADFQVGSKGRLTDYLLFDADLKEASVDLGEVAGKRRVMRPLVGAHVEALELVCSSAADWVLGAVACQVSEVNEPQPDLAGMSDIELVDWVKGRITALQDEPESHVLALVAAHDLARPRLRHFFEMATNAEGVVFWPVTQREAGPTNPARFRALSCISERTRALFSGAG